MQKKIQIYAHTEKYEKKNTCEQKAICEQFVQDSQILKSLLPTVWLTTLKINKSSLTLNINFYWLKAPSIDYVTGPSDQLTFAYDFFF